MPKSQTFKGGGGYNRLASDGVSSLCRPILENVIYECVKYERVNADSYITSRSAALIQGSPRSCRSTALRLILDP